ncbi:hypothetical protein CYMTET_48298 [Cymbomonas tetramitiformis]|uniref:Uncharacterized protein n=1 Tax=Cymbomonas tetramitiformis TaxID=36881 RepID=A0AAE0BU91_9CHLO|nr:hypothetical protein CYMTET_48298 [Cymbomonas tetramitiformis]
MNDCELRAKGLDPNSGERWLFECRKVLVKYLPIDAVVRLSLSAKSLLEILHCPELFRKLHLGRDSGVAVAVNDASLLALASLSQGSLQVLDVTGCPLLSHSALLNVVRSQPDLRRINAQQDLKGENSSFTVGQVEEILLCSPLLEELGVDICHKTADAELLALLRNDAARRALDIFVLTLHYLTEDTAQELVSALTLGVNLAEAVDDSSDNPAARTSWQGGICRTLCLGSTLTQHLGDAGAVQLAALLPGNPHLAMLDVQRNYIGDAGAVELAKGLAQNTVLRQLNLTLNSFSQEGVRAIAAAVPTSACQQLSMGHVGMANAGAEALAPAMGPAGAPITQLELHFCGIEDDGIAALARSLKDNTTLRELNLTGNRIGDAGAAELAALMSTNSCITCLLLDSNCVQAKGSVQLAKALVKHRALRTFSLGGNPIGEAPNAAKAISKLLAGSASLTHLSLSACKFDDDGICEIAWGLAENESVVYLNLSMNMTKDDGACEIAEALSTNESLIELDISKNVIGDKGAKALAACMKSNATLRTLWLVENYISDKCQTTLSSTGWESRAKLLGQKTKATARPRGGKQAAKKPLPFQR